ncbi:hypothetical protein F511_39969 [Dorcoceras hygrometricum]|uniref:Uncharacterized protein n=1 Tax=Dorcoceras hygrometricum TaxID=472368 RepID=A0A2Z7CD56_9LAMI|nr:hypothetical protein F511_39969 [Dorcoceras hygrometricum]
MEHAGMVRMFKTLKDTGLHGFLEDSIGYPRMSASGESSTMMHRLLHASGSHPIPRPYDPKFSYTRVYKPTRHKLASWASTLTDATEQNMPNPKKRKHKGGATKTQTKQAATQITTTPPDTTATKIFENRETVVSTNVDPEEDSETNSCPLVQRRCKKNQLSKLSDSLPLTHLLKRMRTQRQHKPSGWTSTTQPDPISALTTAPEEFPDEKILQGGGVDNFADNLDLYDQIEQDEPKNQNVNVDRPHQIVPTEGEGTNADDEQRDHGSQDPTTLDINLSEQGKGEVNLDEDLNNDARTDHERQPEPDYIADAAKALSMIPSQLFLSTMKATWPISAQQISLRNITMSYQYKLHRKVMNNGIMALKILRHWTSTSLNREKASKSPLHDSIPIIPVNHEVNVAYQRTTNSPQKHNDVVPIQVAQEGGNPEMVEDYCTRSRPREGQSSRPREGPRGRGLTGGRGGSSSQGGRGKGRSDAKGRAKWAEDGEDQVHKVEEEKEEVMIRKDLNIPNGSKS